MPRKSKKTVYSRLSRGKKVKYTKDYKRILFELNKNLKDKNLTAEDLRHHAAFKGMDDKQKEALSADEAADVIARYAADKLYAKILRNEAKAAGYDVKGDPEGNLLKTGRDVEKGIGEKTTDEKDFIVKEEEFRNKADKTYLTERKQRKIEGKDAYKKNMKVKTEEDEKHLDVTMDEPKPEEVESVDFTPEFTNLAEELLILDLD